MRWILLALIGLVVAFILFRGQVMALISRLLESPAPHAGTVDIRATHTPSAVRAVKLAVANERAP